MAIEIANLAYAPNMPGQSPSVRVVPTELTPAGRSEERARQLRKHNVRVDVAAVAHDFLDSDIERARLVAHGISGALNSATSAKRRSVEASEGIVRNTNVGARLKNSYRPA